MMQDLNQSVLINSLRDSLVSIGKSPCQHLQNPDGCSRRASVALIIRIRPHFNHWPEKNSDINADKNPSDLNQFFSTPWVQHGDPEIAFIKRASREGDRWTSHVALPGGKRDPEDEDDKSVAIRETAEEIGLDLSSISTLFVGKLSERVVSTAWGKFPFMVLCPFVFLWVESEMPPLKPQPGEVASIHWVPIRILLSPSSYTHTFVDTSDRFVRRGGVIMKSIMRLILGYMEFPAIRLLPSESLHCSSTDEFFPKEDLTKLKPLGSLKFNLNNLFHIYPNSYLSSKPLLLWGLTLGILVDFLDQLPPHNAIQLWSYPTFTAYDVRLVIKFLTRSLRRKNRASVQLGHKFVDKIDLVGEIYITTSKEKSFESRDTVDNIPTPVEKVRWNQLYAVGAMLEGYYGIVRRGAIIAVSLRLLGACALTYMVVKKYKQ